MSNASEEMLKVLSDFMNSSTEGHRQELDQYIHTCDVSYDTLVRGQKHIVDFRKTHKDFIEALKAELRSPVIYTEEALKTKIYDKGSDHLRYNFQSFLVVNGNEMILVSPSRDALRENITKAQKLMSFGVEMQIGHIAQRDNGGGIASTPAAEKLLDLQFKVEQINSAIPRGLRGVVKNAVEDLARVHKSIRVSFERGTKDISSWSIGDTLIKGSVQVTLETIDSNLGKANMERRAVKQVRDLIKTGSYGAKLAKLAKRDVLDSILDNLKGNKPKAKAAKIESSEATNTAKPVKLNTGKFTLQDARGRFTSVSVLNLKDLINGRLEQELTEQMGKGARKDILNYQTGNFAKTSKVSDVTANRMEGISVFYKYMKYQPGTGKHHAYDSFEPGNAQGLPLSRNPQLLMDKAIRTIAASIVSTRLRTVSV